METKQLPYFKEIEDKAAYYEENQISYDPFNPITMDSKRKCLHCGETFTVRDYKVWVKETDDWDKVKKRKRTFEFIVCPNAPRCDGDVMDWVIPEFGT